jgi:hypothetical protein
MEAISRPALLELLFGFDASDRIWAIELAARNVQNFYCMCVYKRIFCPFSNCRFVSVVQGGCFLHHDTVVYMKIKCILCSYPTLATAHKRLSVVN